MTANEIRGGGPSWIGDPAKAATTAVDCTVRQNRFEDSGSPDGALILGSVRGLGDSISNRFARTKAGEEVAIRLAGKGATTTSQDLTISDNSFVAGPAKAWEDFRWSSQFRPEVAAGGAQCRRGGRPLDKRIGTLGPDSQVAVGCRPPVRGTSSSTWHAGLPDSRSETHLLIGASSRP